MYEAFFGFRERPFQLTPTPRFLFLNAGHREALATLRYGLTSSSGITLLLGEAGTDKTALLRTALHAERRPEHRHVVLSNPTLTPTEFFEILAETFGLPHASGSKGRFLLAFERDLLERHRAGGQTALVVDEGQSLTQELFEEIRLLSNFETETAKLVNVVLVGQPELADRLNDSSLRQFKQRVILRCSLDPLDLRSTACYIASRLRVAGADASEVFTREAVGTIYEASRGIPRTMGSSAKTRCSPGTRRRGSPSIGPSWLTCAGTSTSPATASPRPPPILLPRAMRSPGPRLVMMPPRRTAQPLPSPGRVRSCPASRSPCRAASPDPNRPRNTLRPPWSRTASGFSGSSRNSAMRTFITQARISSPPLTTIMQAALVSTSSQPPLTLG